MRTVLTPAAWIVCGAAFAWAPACESPDISLFDESSALGGNGGDPSPETGGTGGTGGSGGGAGQPPLRNPLVSPFSATSPWNVPLGVDADFVPAGIQPTTDVAFSPAEVIVVMERDAPLVPVHFNGNGFVLDGDRCSSGGKIFGEVPIPEDFVVPNQPGATPNNQATFLLEDGLTLAQTEPFYRCEVAGIGTGLVGLVEDALRGEGLVGATGGSGMSSLGGVLRLGEMRPGGGHVRHALRLHLNGATDISDCTEEAECFRWPADRANDYAVDSYGGTNAALRMGALLAIPIATSLDALGLETPVALELGWTLQNFGGYVVNDAGWSTVSIGMELSPDGRFADQVEQDYALDLDAVAFDTPFARDLARLFDALSVVDDNTAQTPGGQGARVTESAGDLEQP